jgi:hypothetical protein
MSLIAAGSDPLPYQPIRIIDVSPYRRSIHSRPASVRPRRLRRRVAAVTGLTLAVVLMAAGVGAAAGPASGPTAANDLRLAPGHAMPPSLVR